MRLLARPGAVASVIAAVAALALLLTTAGRAGPSRAAAAPGRAAAGVASGQGGPIRLAAGQTGPGQTWPGQTGLGQAGPGQVTPGRVLGRGAAVIRSFNWAGFAAARRGTTFRSLRAAFFVPYADCQRTPGSYSSHWIGLDGLNSSSVEQLGVAAGCAGPRPKYYAWYEMYPKPVSGVFAVRPGNAIVASVSYRATSQTFVLSLRDVTTGQNFTRSAKCAARACVRSSAEVISEAPSDTRGNILPLADYRAESFSAVTLTTAAGRRGGLSAPWWSTYRIVGVGQSSRQLTQQPTALLHGQAFANYWLREN
jgi:hypothetical protein